MIWGMISAAQTIAIRIDMKDTFSKMHPITNIVFFSAVIIFSMFYMHPVCLTISLLCAFANAVAVSGKIAAFFGLKFLLPTALMLIIINPLFNHRGKTIICYLPWDNPLTLESIIYGFATAALVCAVALWFHTFNKVMTSDKLIYLFGRIAPALGLVLSMALRFIPRFTAQFKLTKQCQKQITYCGKKSLIGRIKAIARVFSIMVSWSMENAMDTSDSMKGRGYGLKGRSAYSRFRFTRDDAVVLAIMLSGVIGLIMLIIFGGVKYRYFPSFKGNFSDAPSVLFYCIYAVLCLMPIAVNGREGLRWKRLRSRI